MSADTDSSYIPVLADIHAAQSRTLGKVRQTPILTASSLDDELGIELFIKCEHLQHTGAFKFRGACNAITRLRENHVDGDVATHSSGNHGSALAAAARIDGRVAHVVMPVNSSPIKLAAVKHNGGQVHLCEATQSGRESGLKKLVKAGHIPIPPYDHADIISGQATAALEMMQAHPDLEVLLTPVGGGGLISGTALVASHYGVAVFAAEPAGAADTATSLAEGKRIENFQADTIADGLRSLVGLRNFDIIQQHVDQVLTVSDAEISAAMGLFWRHTRMLIEPSSAVVIAALRRYPEHFSKRKTGVIITGSNIDPSDWVSLTGANHE